MLHKKYYDILFPVVFALANKLNVQLFIATHSIEAIDAILRYGNYENNNANNDPIKVITLKKVDDNIRERLRHIAIPGRNHPFDIQITFPLIELINDL